MKIYPSKSIEYKHIKDFLNIGKCNLLKPEELELLSQTYKEFYNNNEEINYLEVWLILNPKKLMPLYNELKLIK